MKKFKQLENDNVGKFILYNDQIEIGEIHYKRKNQNTIIATHTEVEKKYRGNGHGLELIDKLVDFARNNHLKVIPVCSYVKETFERNTNYRDIKA